MVQIEVVQSVIPHTEERMPLVEACEVGVHYVLGGRREDIKSRTHNFFRRKQPQELWALRKVSFTAQTGEIWGVIGSNGAGKTTLCRVLAGLLRPDEGTISVRGSVSALLSLGTGFNERLSGKENIFLNGMMLGFSKREIVERLPDIIAFSGLERFIDQPLDHYSSGMLSRLGFSIAAMMEPEILIIDETLSVGDLAFSEKAGEKIHELTNKAKLVIIVTHQLPFLLTHCTQALWIEHGTVKVRGKAEEVAELYRNFIATSPVRRKIVEFPLLESRRGSACVVDVRHVDLQFPLLRGRSSNPGRPGVWAPLRRRYVDACQALNNVSFEVYEGEVLGIVGSNGAGKTTLCRVLAGILKADRGEMTVKGEITALLTFGAGFNERLSGHDNVFLNGMMLGIPKQELRAMYPDIVAFSGLAEFINQPLKHYSQGMRARLGFSIAAMIKPDVFIIDEALSVGDASFAEQASVKIQELIVGAKAVIVVSHNVEFLQKVCTKVLWLDEGQARALGNPGAVVEQYQQAVMSVARRENGR